MCGADPNILNAIYNSEALNDVFMSNFLKDPTLTWQYFGSSTGFFRIYPGETVGEKTLAHTHTHVVVIFFNIFFVGIKYSEYYHFIELVPLNILNI